MKMVDLRDPHAPPLDPQEQAEGAGVPQEEERRHVEEDLQVLDGAHLPVHEPEQVPDRELPQLHAERELVGVDLHVGGHQPLRLVRGGHLLRLHEPDGKKNG